MAIDASAVPPRPLGLRGASKPRNRSRLTHEVVESIAGQIIGGQLPPETLLPSEAVMAESFGVSRTVIRESLKVLENIGLVLKQQGKLSWTAPSRSWDLLDPIVLASRLRHDPDLSFLDDLVTVRAALEAEMAAQAAMRASDEELDAIGEALEELEERLSDAEGYKSADAAFHDAVLRASHNDLARAIVTAIHSKGRASAQYTTTPTPDGLIRLSHEGHVAVLEAIRAREPARAAAAMREHIRSTWAWRHDGPVASPQWKPLRRPRTRATQRG